MTYKSTMLNIFEPTVTAGLLERLNKLTPSSQALWGKMSVAQMLAHCNVTYEMVYEPEKHQRPNAFIRFILKSFVKDTVVGEKPYKHHSKTAPAFLIKEDKDFERERARLIDYINKTRELGPAHFEGKESNSFGALTANEWNNMFYKHLDHHLRQFGV